MPKFEYDLAVIGGGSAGLVASKFATGMKKKVALIEKEHLGGECTWTGCIPSKTLINAAKKAQDFHKLSSFGLSLDGGCSLNTSRLFEHIQQVIQDIYTTHTPEQLESLGIEVIKGAAEFKNENTLLVGGRSLTAKKIIIATGSHSFIPPLTGLASVPYYTNQSIFSLKEIPKRLVILGGGAIGVELACAFNSLASSVTIIEMGDRILHNQDAELADLLATYMKENGIEILTGHKAEAVSKQGDEVVVSCIDPVGASKKIAGDIFLIAVGRRPSIEGLGLEKVGIKSSKKGIEVNKQLQTSLRSVYACGDVVGPYLFSHMAYYQASIATRNALLPFWASVDYTNVAWVTFADPEFASAGLTEKQAKARYGNSISIYRYDYAKLDRAHTDSALRGMGKIICASGKIVGAHILGERAGEIIHEIQLGKTYAISFTDFYKVIHAYPTYSELIWHSAKAAYIKKIKNNVIVRVVEKMSHFLGGN